MAIQMRRGLMYIVIELQASDGKVANIVTNYTDHEESYTH